MKKKALVSKLGLALLVGLILAMPSAEALARDGSWGGRAGVGRGGSGGNRHETVVVSRRIYDYREGRFFWPSFFGFGLFVAQPPMGAVVTYLPAGHRTLIVSGNTYFYDRDVYYRSCPTGYVVVPGPSGNFNGEQIIINVPNSRGTYTPVILVRQGNGFVGPQGEYYGSVNIDQLKALYGR